MDDSLACGVDLKKTPLHFDHLAKSARMAEFAGYDMPISYDQITGGMKAEHLLVRENAGMFDVSHMGEFWIEGSDATKFLNHACTRSFDKLSEGKAQYCLLLSESGAILDDIIVYKFNSEKYWMVVNASNLQKDFNHLKKLSTGYKNLALRDVSETTALIALQGPQAENLMNSLGFQVRELKYYHFITTDKNWIIGRTGYTGEDGFEIFLPPSEAPDLWRALEQKSVLPIGLGARDSLRLEVGFPLYGHELGEDLLAHETLSAFAIGADHNCLGSRSFEKPPRYIPGGFTGVTPKPLRAGEKVFLNDIEVGWLSSGSYSPQRKQGIGLGFLKLEKLPKKPLEELIFMLESGPKRREVKWELPPFVETRRAKKRNLQKAS